MNRKHDSHSFSHRKHSDDEWSLWDEWDEDEWNHAEIEQDEDEDLQPPPQLLIGQQNVSPQPKKRRVAIWVGIVIAVVLLLLSLGIYIPLFVNIHNYKPLGTNPILVEQICILQSQAYDNHVYVTPYDNEENLAISQRSTFTVTKEQVQIQGDIVKFPWFLNLLGIYNGYKLISVGSTSAQTQTVFNSHDWLFTTAPKLPILSWLVNVSPDTTPIVLNLNAKPGSMKQYNLSLTDSGPKLTPSPLTSSSCK